MHSARIVLCGEVFSALRAELASLGIDARLDDQRRGLRDLLIVDRRGAGSAARPESGAALCLAWVDVADVTPGFHAALVGADDFIAGPLTGPLVAARVDLLVKAQSTEDRFTLLTRALSDAMWDLDVRTGAIVWSNGISAQFGYDASVASGFNWWLDNVHPADRDRVASKIEDVFQAGESWTDEYRFRHADGQYRPTLDRGVVMRDDDGHAVRMVGAMTDVGERRVMEARLAQAEHLTTMGTLAAGIAHEINNPLAIAAAHLEQISVALELGDLGDARAHLDAVHQACVRVAAIVGDLRVANRRPDAQAGPVDVGNAITSALALTRNEIRHRAQLVRTVATVPPVLGSEVRLVQVLVNLLLNGAQAIPEGDAAHNEIHLDVREVGADIVIELRDTGVGMSPDELAQAFEPFFSRREGGTGIGLSICRDIVRSMDGTITLESAPGRGTLVRLRFPAAAATRIPSLLPPEPNHPAPRLAVMLIDDEADLRMVMATGLAQHEVTACASATEALEILGTGKRFDAILCDLMMPDMTGMDFHEALTALDPDQARRTGFVTGGAFTPRAQAFVDGRAARILEKPFRLADLAAMVARLAQVHST